MKKLVISAEEFSLSDSFYIIIGEIELVQCTNFALGSSDFSPALTRSHYTSWMQRAKGAQGSLTGKHHFHYNSNIK